MLFALPTNSFALVNSSENKIYLIKITGSNKNLFNKEDEDEILNFVYENRNRLREMSLRTALKVGDLKKISEKWQSLAVSTCMKRV